MYNRITVTTQSQLDKISTKLDAEIHINSKDTIYITKKYLYPVDVDGSTKVVAKKNSEVWGNDEAEIYGFDNAELRGNDKSKIHVGDNNIVHLFETSKCFLTGNAIVYARENTEVESYGENEGNVFNVKTIKL